MIVILAGDCYCAAILLAFGFFLRQLNDISFYVL